MPVCGCLQAGDSDAVQAALEPALAAIAARQHKLVHLTGPAADWLTQVKAPHLQLESLHLLQGLTQAPKSHSAKLQASASTTLLQMMSQRTAKETCQGRSGTATAQVKAEAPFLLRYTSAYIHTAMCTTAVSLLEKQRHYQEATELLQQLLGGLLTPGQTPCAHAH